MVWLLEPPLRDPGPPDQAAKSEPDHPSAMPASTSADHAAAAAGWSGPHGELGRSLMSRVPLSLPL